MQATQAVAAFLYAIKHVKPGTMHEYLSWHKGGTEPQTTQLVVKEVDVQRMRLNCQVVDSAETMTFYWQVRNRMFARKDDSDGFGLFSLDTYGVRDTLPLISEQDVVKHTDEVRDADLLTFVPVHLTHWEQEALRHC